MPDLWKLYLELRARVEALEALERNFPSAQAALASQANSEAYESRLRAFDRKMREFEESAPDAKGRLYRQAMPMTTLRDIFIAEPYLYIDAACDLHVLPESTLYAYIRECRRRRVENPEWSSAG